jgi:hypothetical protein
LIVDLFLVYSFIRRLTTPFEKWDAYTQGVIDKDGNILKKKNERNTRAEMNSFGVFDLMILKLKKLLAKVPGGSSRIASYAAALWLIREWNHFSNESLLNESTSDRDLDASIDLFLDRYFYYTDQLEDVNQKSEIDEAFEKKFIEEEPTVNVGSGAIAGLGIGPQGEPGLTLAQMKRYKRKNKGPKKLRDIIGAKL